MIYPFTRIVVYGVIWYQGKENFNIYIDIVSFIHVGESNRGYNADKYACAFSKMIEYWRETWHERTNRTTDIQFPFGFVQVGFFRIIKNTFIQ